jgi:glycosyltransferase involved in cell wall biosynthesis
MNYLSSKPPKVDAISVIIPTWNEGAWLPALLSRLDSLEGVAEIIVADNGSSDSTVDIAKRAGCVLVKGGLPAVGRNAGGQLAKEDLLLFVDADVCVSSQVLASIQKEFDDPSRMLIHFRLIPLTGGIFVRTCYRAVSFYAYWSGKVFYHQGSAPLICVRRHAFITVGGFDEHVEVGEDVEFIRRVDRVLGGVAYIRDTPLYVSARRFELENKVVYALKSIMWGLLRLLGLRASVINYRWQSYPAFLADHDGTGIVRH